MFRKRKPMTRGKRITLATLVAVVITATILLLMPPPSRKITIDLDTDPGTRVTGSFSVDGLLTPFDAETPSLIEVRGRNVVFSITKDYQPGRLTVRMFIDAEEKAAISTTTGPGETVECGFRSGNGIIRPVRVWAGKPENQAQE